MEPLRELPHLELQINTRFNKTPFGGVGDDYWKGTYRQGRMSRQSKAPSRLRIETKKETYPRFENTTVLLACIAQFTHYQLPNENHSAKYSDTSSRASVWMWAKKMSPISSDWNNQYKDITAEHARAKSLAEGEVIIVSSTRTKWKHI